jgi:CRP/FNR family cyclic AMP-dependent transcriptional regulator
MNVIDPALPQSLTAHPFLAGLNEHQIGILADCAEIKRFAADEHLFAAGDPARGFYLVEGGSIAVETGAPAPARVVIDTVRAGEPLGWSWLFEPYVCEYGARATEPTATIFVDAVRLAEHRGADLTLSHELFKRMSGVMVRRLTAARRRLAAAGAAIGS